MKSRIGRWVAALLVVAASTAGVQVVSAPAAFAVGCTGGACTGLDPEVQGCGADATTVDSFLGHYQNNIGRHVYVELRHSSACRARWLRITPEPSDWGCGGGSPLEARLRNISTTGAVIAERTPRFSACDSRFWTRMVGRTSNSARTQFCFRETHAQFGADSYYFPCKSLAWP